MKHISIVFVALVIATVGSAFTPTTLVAFLKSIAGKHSISGQFIERGPLDPVAAIYQNTGKWLGLVGGDYWWFGEKDFDGSHSYNQYAIQYWKAGGLVTMSCSMPNPTTSGAVYDVSNLNVHDLFTAGTDTNNNWMKMLTNVALGIQELQRSGVVVMFRPYHENNGDWFWWGTKFLSDQQFVDMWQYTHTFMTVNMKLDNIVWLWAVNSGQDRFSRYPGSEYVDTVGHDLYTSNPSQGQATYNNLLKLGKPVVLAEFGAGSPQQGDKNFNETKLISDIKATMSDTVLWQQWWDGNGGNVGWGFASVKGGSQALHDPWVLNRDDLKAAAADFLHSME